jgi:sporulation protein YlmC with PRC-barrel domain
MEQVDKTQFLTASTIKGEKVINKDGEHLGKIEDLMIDLENRRVVYAILSFGGFLGIGDKHFAIPLEALSQKPNEHAFTLDISKEVLEKAEGFDKENIPSDPEELTSIYTHYGYKPYWQTEVLGLSEKYRLEGTESERMTRIKSESQVLKAKEEVKAEESIVEKAEEARAEVARIEKTRAEKARAEGAEKARVEAAKLEKARVEAAKLEGTKVEEVKVENAKVEEEANVEPIHPSENRGGKKRSLLDTCK